MKKKGTKERVGIFGRGGRGVLLEHSGLHEGTATTVGPGSSRAGSGVQRAEVGRSTAQAVACFVCPGT